MDVYVTTLCHGHNTQITLNLFARSIDTYPDCSFFIYYELADVS